MFKIHHLFWSLLKKRYFATRTHWSAFYHPDLSTSTSSTAWAGREFCKASHCSPWHPIGLHRKATANPKAIQWQSPVLSNQGQKVTSEQLGNKRLFLATKQRGPEVGGRKWGGAGEERGRKGSCLWEEAHWLKAADGNHLAPTRPVLKTGEKAPFKGASDSGPGDDNIRPTFPGIEKSGRGREGGRGIVFSLEGKVWAIVN